MELVGKSREEIAQATRNLSREQMVDLLYRLATLEPMFTPQEIAAARRISKRSVLLLIKDGTIRPRHKPIKNGVRIPLSAIVAWDQNTKQAA